MAQPHQGAKGHRGDCEQDVGSRWDLPAESQRRSTAVEV